MVHIFGIRNCDTIRKARRWLDETDVDYIFHDFKLEGIDTKRLKAWCGSVGWESLLNRRGLTWRSLNDDQKQDMDEARAIVLMTEYPTLVKRPVLELGDHIEVGFSSARYTALLT